MKVDPPPIKVGHGRPRKSKIKDPFKDPKKTGTLSRHGMEMTCTLCKAKGHNKRVCPKKGIVNPLNLHQRSQGVDRGKKQPLLNLNHHNHIMRYQLNLHTRGRAIGRGGGRGGSTGSSGGGSGGRGSGGGGSGGRGSGGKGAVIRGRGAPRGRGRYQVPARVGVSIAPDGTLIVPDLIHNTYKAHNQVKPLQSSIQLSDI
ncbi:Translation initiation factor IF-2 [Bienertia sinuspersici]